ncbi:MAG: xanthine dehydrogenase family protein, partial [Elusimicrobia bacterium]|nr:xanthine dehydrogenase family protein [Elusimicrobiota bacterium]
MGAMSSVGKSPPRREGPEKLTGRALYLDDREFPGAWHGVTVRSTIPHGRIKALRFDPAFPWKECVVVTAKDIPGKNLVTLIETVIEKGDLGRGFADADVVVEGEYSVPAQEHAYIENNAIAAFEDADGVLTVTGSLQCPYYIVKALKAILGREESRVRVIQTPTGGGFGGKEEYPSMIAGHAALLALKAGRPVKLVYDRHEDMAATTKRHPAFVRHRTGLKKDGTLVAQDIDVLMDGGAYATLSAVVLSRGTLHAAGAYQCPNVRVRSRAVATNTPPNGAFRGFGAPQTLFAVELHWEKV